MRQLRRGQGPLRCEEIEWDGRLRAISPLPNGEGANGAGVSGNVGRSWGIEAAALRAVLDYQDNHRAAMPRPPLTKGESFAKERFSIATSARQTS